MEEKELDTGELVSKTLTVLPMMAKKLFGPLHVLHNSDLHPTHFHILNIVADVNSIRTTEIAEKLAIKKSNLTPLVNKLVEKGFITRRKDDEDRRVIFVELTEEGAFFLKEKKQLLEDKVRGNLAKLSLEDQKVLQQAVINLDLVLSKLDEE